MAYYRQWAEREGNYTPVGRTVPEIAPGYYDLSLTQEGLFFVPVRARTDELLRFPDSPSLEVIKAIQKFWEREEMFRRYQLPFKRGILLYGPPGSGKSATLQLVARDVVARNGLVVNYNDKAFLMAYRALREIQPEIPVVVLMEDLDAIVKRTNESSFLNMLDGVERLDRVCFLATTNYQEQLEDRIVNRPSRFDVRIKIGHPSAVMRRMYLEGLIVEGDEIDVAQYVKDSDGMSLAHLKELFIATHILGTDYTTVVQRLKDMQLRPESEVGQQVVKQQQGLYY